MKKYMINISISITDESKDLFVNEPYFTNTPPILANQLLSKYRLQAPGNDGVLKVAAPNLRSGGGAVNDSKCKLLGG